MKRRDFVKVMSVAPFCLQLPFSLSPSGESENDPMLMLASKEITTYRNKIMPLLPHESWDFATCIGDTIFEKYQNLATTLEKYDYQIILTSPEVASIFETIPHGFKPAYTEGKSCIFCGTINKKWRLYKTKALRACDLIMIKKAKQTQTWFYFGIRNYVI